MLGKDNKTLAAKEWRIESTCPELLFALAPYRCSGGHQHVDSLGSFLTYTACYTSFMSKIIAHVLLAVNCRN